MKRLYLFLLALLLVTVWAFAAFAADDFTVLSFSRGDQGANADLDLLLPPRGGQELRRQGAEPGGGADRVLPVKGVGKWTAVDTFVYTPVATRRRPPCSRSAKGEPEGCEGRLLAGRQSFEYRTEGLRFIGARQIDVSDGGAVTIELSFNLPVSPVRLRGFLYLLNERREQLGYTVQGQAPASTIRVTTGYFGGGAVSLVLSPGLTSDVGPLGTEQESRRVIKVTRQLAITSLYPDTRYPSTSVIQVGTNIGADMSKVSKYIELSPASDFTIDPQYNGFVILGDFKPRQRVEVTIRKGLPSREGSALTEDFKKAVVFPDHYPSISFPSGGVFLSPAGDLRVPIESVNIEEISLNLWRVYENNIPLSMTMSGYNTQRDLSRNVASRTARPEGELNETVRRAIDLRELARAKGPL